MRKPRLSGNLLADVDARAWIYAVQSGEFVKIGKTGDPIRRFGEMRLHNPHPMRLLARWVVSKNSVHAVETRIHELLADWRYGREWFTAPLTEIRQAAKAAIAEARRIERQDIALLRAARRAAAEADRRGLDVESHVASELRLARQWLSPRRALPW